MGSFATVGELAAFTGRDLSQQDAGALLALELASGAIVAWCGQAIERVVGDLARLDGVASDRIVLPERPVTAVGEVRIGGTVVDPQALAHSASGVLARTDGGDFSAPPGGVQVTYDHGYDPIPEAVRAVCLQVAARALANPEGIRQEGIGGYSVTYASAGVLLRDDEREALAGLRDRGAW